MVVRINRVVTRGGDHGQTSLGDGSSVDKSDLRIDAIGTLDELNSVIGILRAALPESEAALSSRLGSLQGALFDVGADLCQPENGKPTKRIPESFLESIEFEIERLQQRQQPLQSFILPGGTMPAAISHLARTVARRAERDIVALAARDSLNPVIVKMVNRLSDYFFVLARALNDDGKADVLWQPNAPLFQD